MYFSYMLQCQHIGVLVYWLHDWADIPGCLARMCLDFSTAIPSAIFMICVIISWGYSRLYVFPHLIYEGYRFDIGQAQIEGLTRDSVSGPHMAIIFFMVCLYILHWFWWIKFNMIIYDYVVKGKAEDNVNTIKVKTQ